MYIKILTDMLNQVVLDAAIIANGIARIKPIINEMINNCTVRFKPLNKSGKLSKMIEKSIISYAQTDNGVRNSASLSR